MEGIQETFGFINEVRRLTRDAKDGVRTDIRKDHLRKQRIYELHQMREDATMVAKDEWPSLQNIIRETAMDGYNELTWGLPAFAEKEKDEYYREAMMVLLKEHGFTTSNENSGILVKW